MAECPRMAYAYYNRLTRAQQRIYRQSDAVTSVPLPGTASLRPLVAELTEALASGERLRTQAATLGAPRQPERSSAFLPCGPGSWPRAPPAAGASCTGSTPLPDRAGLPG